MQPMYNGQQSIHLAASEGHEAVVRMLVDEFYVMPDAASNVAKVNDYISVCHVYNYIGWLAASTPCLLERPRESASIVG